MLILWREGKQSREILTLVTSTVLQHIARKKGWVISVVGAVIAMVVLMAILFSGPSEPVYEGKRLSEWLDPTTATRGNLQKMITFQKVATVIQSVGPEALPWPVNVAEPEARFAQRFYDLYAQFYSKYSFARSFLPKPRAGLSNAAHYQVLMLLSRLAPGTKYEKRALSAVMRPRLKIPRSGVGEIRCGMLAQFTNNPAAVLPLLLVALTNVGTVDSAVAAFQRFGTSATPVLYPKALSETGFVRPAELALKKTDPAAYERLLIQKSQP